jgi:hypothetical protein
VIPFPSRILNHYCSINLFNTWGPLPHLPKKKEAGLYGVMWVFL